LKEISKKLSYISKIGIYGLETEKKIEFTLSFNDNELVQIKKGLNLISIRKTSMSGRIIATAANQWHLKAKIGATIVQESVLSLKPVTTRIDDSVDRRIIKGRDNAVQKSELELNEDHFIEHELDLGAIFFESIALSIPIFPKEKGESFEDKIFTAKGIDPLTDDRISPFFILNKLKEKDQSE
jgi:uncharacterized metal-binding protein YceD (DUF177 family)